MCTLNDDSRFYEDSAALVGTTEVAITVDLNLQGIQGHQSQAVFLRCMKKCQGAKVLMDVKIGMKGKRPSLASDA